MNASHRVNLREGNDILTDNERMHVVENGWQPLLTDQ